MSWKALYTYSSRTLYRKLIRKWKLHACDYDRSVCDVIDSLMPGVGAPEALSCEDVRLVVGSIAENNTITSLPHLVACSLGQKNHVTIIMCDILGGVLVLLERVGSAHSLWPKLLGSTKSG